MNKNKIVQKFITFLEWYGIIQFFRKKSISEDIIFLTADEEKQRLTVIKNAINNYTYHGDLSKEHLVLLEKLVEEEKNRQNVIENKLGQIIGQSGIIFTLIALFVPMFNGQLASFHPVLKIVILVLFIAGFLFFLLSIIQATKSFNIKNFIYSSPSVDLIWSDRLNTKELFIQDKIKSIVTGLPINSKTNNTKGNLLLYAHRAFTIGFLSIGLLGIIVTFSFIFHKEEKKVITIESQEEIKNLERRQQDLKTQLNVFILKGLIAKDSLKTMEMRSKFDSIDNKIIQIKNQRQIKSKTK